MLYVYGSEDSLDVDVIYIKNKLPSMEWFKKIQGKQDAITVEETLICPKGKKMNRNFATLDESGKHLKEVMIGLPDETNNAIVHTYNLHYQLHPLILKPVKRDVFLKAIRCIRIILTFNTRTVYRRIVKKALKSPSLIDRIKALQTIDLEPPYNKKHISDIEIQKKIAFQLGQTNALLNGKELYTKREVSEMYPELASFIYRKGGDAQILRKFRDELLSLISGYEEVDEYVYYDGHKYDVKKEVRVE